MPNPRGQPGAMPASRLCTGMHSVGSRRRGLISASDGTQTSKCPYTCVCNQARCMGIRGHIGAYIGTERCILQDAPLCTSEVGA